MCHPGAYWLSKQRVFCSCGWYIWITKAMFVNRYFPVYVLGVTDMSSKPPFWIDWLPANPVYPCFPRLNWRLWLLIALSWHHHFLVGYIPHWSFTFTFALPNRWLEGYVTKPKKKHLSYNFIKTFTLYQTYLINQKVSKLVHLYLDLMKTPSTSVPKTGVTSPLSPDECTWRACKNPPTSHSGSLF